MPLVQHTKLGPYEIVEMIAAGGMGEVYRAHDSRLKRDVALKVLPRRLASDPERMERFEREAQLLASINHPNIASIYGLEESSDIRAFVMELVEGPTLAERLARGALPLSEALAIARQIAEAVEYAHERGIIHRDVKPANIKLTSDDSVKVLDFGLAKALSDDAQSSDASTSPTLTAAATQLGIIVGTAAYMSPEQARGRAVDRRTDVWAFGCVLFEMLTGKLAFSGETTTDTLATVLTKEPEYDQLPATIPTSIRRLIGKCLQKQPKVRLQAMGDARIEIEDCLTGKSFDWLVQATMGNADCRSAIRAKRLRLLEILAAFLIAVGAGSIVWWLKPSPTRNRDWTADTLAPLFVLGSCRCGLRR